MPHRRLSERYSADAVRWPAVLNSKAQELTSTLRLPSSSI